MGVSFHWSQRSVAGCVTVCFEVSHTTKEIPFLSFIPPADFMTVKESIIEAIMVTMLLSAILVMADVPSDEEVRRLQLELSVENVRMSDPSSLQQQRLLQRELFEKTRTLTQIKLDEKELVKKLTSTGRYPLPRTDSKPSAYAPKTPPTPPVPQEHLETHPQTVPQENSGVPTLTESQTRSLNAIVSLWRSRDLYKALEAWKRWLKENQQPDPKRENDLAVLAAWVAQRATDSSIEYSSLEKYLLDAAKEQQSR